MLATDGIDPTNLPSLSFLIGLKIVSKVTDYFLLVSKFAPYFIYPYNSC